MIAIWRRLTVPHGIHPILSHESSDLHHIWRWAIGCTESWEPREGGEISKIETTRGTGRYMVFEGEMAVARCIASRRSDVRGIKNVGVNKCNLEELAEP
jgi:hypothetical protein